MKPQRLAIQPSQKLHSCRGARRGERLSFRFGVSYKRRYTGSLGAKQIARVRIRDN